MMKSDSTDVTPDPALSDAPSRSMSLDGLSLWISIESRLRLLDAKVEAWGDLHSESFCEWDHDYVMTDHLQMMHDLCECYRDASTRGRVDALLEVRVEIDRFEEGIWQFKRGFASGRNISQEEWAILQRTEDPRFHRLTPRAGEIPMTPMDGTPALASLTQVRR